MMLACIFSMLCNAYAICHWFTFQMSILIKFFLFCFFQICDPWNKISTKQTTLSHWFYSKIPTVVRNGIWFTTWITLFSFLPYLSCFNLVFFMYFQFCKVFFLFVLGHISIDVRHCLCHIKQITFAFILLW